MNEVIIPPSPSWYLTNVLACSDDGKYMAYGAKHELVVFRLSYKPESLLSVRPSFISMAHKDRINAVVFAPSSSEFHKNRVVTSSDDGSVRVWDCESLTLLFSHSGHADGQKLPSVDWSRADPNLIVSVSENGSIVCWDLMTNTIRRLNVGVARAVPYCLACCPHNKDIGAIGAKAGLLVIFNMKGDGSVLFRIRGHESDVISLAWCPVPDNIFKKDKSEKPLLLASGSKDRAIYFWRTATDGRFETLVNLPAQPLASGYRHKNGTVSGGTAWITLKWPDPYTLITSSLYGELLAFDLEALCNQEKSQDIGKKQKSKGFRLVHGIHNKGLFNIGVSNVANLVNDKIVWSYAIDKHIVAAELKTGKIVLDKTGIGGIVYCLAASPLDPNRVAIGVGDNKVLIWNIGDSSCDNITTFWNKISNKVMAVAWHPTKDSIIAFSTGEGRIGVMDISTNKPPILLRLHHRRSVYSLVWAQPIIPFVELKSRKWDLALFSVGDGEIVQYDVDTPDKEPFDLAPKLKACDELAKVAKTLGRTDLTWNHDQSLAAVGNDNGLVYIVDGQNFKCYHTLFSHKKLVQCLVWHPATVTSENNISPNSKWLASAGDNIQVIEITKEDFKTIATFTSHTEKVVSIAWSPHFSGRLFSASYDYTCQVWDVVSGNMIACYDGHHNAVLCCLPSPLHPDYVITGSADNSVHVWNMKKYVTCLTPKSKKQRLSGALKKFAGVQEAACNGIRNVPTITNGNETKNQNAPEKIMEKVASIPHEPKHKSSSMFPLISSSLSLAKSLDVLWSRINDEETLNDSPPTDVAYLDFFGNSQKLRKLVSEQEKSHRENNHLANANHLALWSGDLSKTLKAACQKKQLSDWLISLAPMVSHRMWLDCCECYARQLAETGDALKASSYYLSIHKLEEAIDVLINAKLGREAVALAKSRLPASDPTVVKALIAWGNQTNCLGNLSLTSHCFLAAGKTYDAIETLARSKDAKSLSLAAQMAEKIGSKEMATSLIVRSVSTSLNLGHYSKAKESLQNLGFMKDLLAWVEVCELISEGRQLNLENGLEWICGNHEVNRGVLTKAFDICKHMTPSYDVLVRHIPSKPPCHSIEKTWVYIGGQLTLALAARLNSSIKLCLQHLLSALNTGYSCIFQSIPNIETFILLCYWIAPKGPLSEIELLMDDCEKMLVESLRTFICCGAVYWLEKLAETTSIDDDSNLEKIYQVVKKAAELVLVKDILDYFKNCLEIKNLERSIAAAKLNIPVTVKYCTDIEAELCRTESCPEVSKSVDQDEGKLSEKEEKDVNDDTNSSKTQLLSELKDFNRKFEDKRCYTPNPVIVYFIIEKVLRLLIAKKETENGNETLNAVIKMWEAVSSN